MKQTHPDTLTLLSHLNNDLPAARQQGVQEHIASCIVCRRQCMELEQQHQEFLQKHPFESLSVAPLGSHSSKAQRWYAIAATLVLTTAAGILYQTLPGNASHTMRSKGETPTLTLFVRESDGSAAQRANHVYRPGEHIQFTLTTRHPAYLALLSIDSSGTITMYYPTNSDSALPVAAGDNSPLPHSIELDSAQGKELFMALVSPAPFVVPPLQDTLENWFALYGLDTARYLPRLPGNLSLHRQLITKEGVAP